MIRAQPNVSISAEKRLMIRPNGFVSKKLIGLFRTPSNNALCISLEAKAQRKKKIKSLTDITIASPILRAEYTPVSRKKLL